MLVDSSILIKNKNRILYRLPMQNEKSKPEGKRIMRKTSFTEFPALSVDPKVGISLSVHLKTIFDYFFLPMTLKIITYHSSFLIFLTFYNT